MPTSQIKYKITTKKALKPDTFKDYIEYIFNNFKESEAKKMANAFIGDLGRKYNKTNHGFTCSDYDTALCCWTSALSEGKNLTIDNHEDIYLVKEQRVERLFSDHTSVNRFVVSQGILKCLNLLFACHNENSKVYGISTEGIYLSNPSTQFKKKKNIKFKTKHIGKAFTTDSKLVYFEKHYRDNLDISDFKMIKGDGCIFTGGAGCGKTTWLCKMVEKEENPLVLSFTNKAIENVKNRHVKNEYKNANDICHTFDSYFCEWNGRHINSLEGKTIFIEEFSMVPNKWMTKIYEAFTMFNNTIYMFGDMNQCSPVEAGSQISYDYTLSKTVKSMCSKTETLKYIEDSSRYDKKTYDILEKFLIYGRVSQYFEPVNKKLLKNICYLNKTRIEVNTKCCDQFVEGKRYELVTFKYNGKTETYKICEGIPVIATVNMKDKNIYNTMEFEIEDIRKDFDDETDDSETNKKTENKISFCINDEWFDEKEFSESFIPSFCVTVYKYQGASIDEPYNIHDVNRMDKKQLYTALSRTTKLEYIHLNFKKLNNVYKERMQPLLELMNSRFNSLFKNGKVYKISFDNDKIYIGFTCEELETRLKWHLTNEKSQVFKFKNNNPKIELIVNCPCDSRKSLEQTEIKHIHDNAEIYGENMINKKSNPNNKPKKIQFKVEIEKKNHN